MPVMSTDYAHIATPAIVVSDPRGLVVRSVQYHRRQANDPVETRVTRQSFDEAGRLAGSHDPYLFALAQTDESVPTNLTQVMSLSGVPLSSESVDAGWRVALHGGAGQIRERWDGRVTHALTDYDELLRPVAVHECGSGVADHVLERFTYAAIDAEAIEHNLCGQMIRHDDPAGTLHRLDTGLGGAPLRQTRHFLRESNPPDWPNALAERDALLEPGEGASTLQHYAANGELLDQTDAFGNRQSFAHTIAGELKDTRLTLAGDAQVEKLLVSDIQYNVSGQVEAETAGNSVITRHRYDPANGRLKNLSAHKANGTALQDLSYSYDAVGNVLNLEDAAQPIRYFNNQRIEPIKTYRYDTLYQLIHATGWEAKTGHGGPALPDRQPLPLDPNQIANYTQTYHYDAGGNLLELVHAGAQPQGRTLTRARYSNRCLPEREGRPPTEEELAAGFDANGNLRELQAGQPLDWDLRNQLSAVRSVIREAGNDDSETYIYDGSGQRVRKVRSSQTKTRTLISEVRYLPGLEIRTHGGTGEILHVITASAGSNSVQVLHWAAKPPDEIDNDQVRYTLNDHLKSSTLELDQQAGLISEEWYYPFGGTACWAARSVIEAAYKTVRYSGKERDATGLYYYGFRYYASWLQRWINPDPAGDIDGLNRYKMVGNNPIAYFDSAGLGLTPTGENKQIALANKNSEQITAYYDPDLLHHLRSQTTLNERIRSIDDNMDHELSGKHSVTSTDNNNQFENTFTKEAWIFEANQRDKNNIDYYASDVGIFQYTIISRKNNFFGYLPQQIIRSNVINSATLDKTKQLTNKSEELYKVFLNETENGKSTQRILASIKMRAVIVEIKYDELDNKADFHIHIEPIPQAAQLESVNDSGEAVLDESTHSIQQSKLPPFWIIPPPDRPLNRMSSLQPND
jgi:insecticidal toxin complex protein TccC